MQKLLNVSLFRFNIETDVLPYYENIEIFVDLDITIETFLKSLQEKTRNFSYQNKNIKSVRINGIIVNLDKLISTINLDKEVIKIEPLDTFYSTHDLTLQTNSFYKNFELFKKFTDDEDFELYNQLIDLYYASPTLKFERDFYGVPLFLLADFLINKKPEFAKNILSIIAEKDHGIWLHTTLNSVLHDKELATDVDNVISKLKRDILKYIPNINTISKREYKRSQRLYI